MTSISNWFSGSSESEDAMDFDAKRKLQSAYQYYDSNYGIMQDTQYGTYYNYVTSDLYNPTTGDNYNYVYNLYTYYSTTTTNSVTYSKTYIPATFTKVYNPPVYTKVDKKVQEKKKTDNKKKTGTTTPVVAKVKKAADGTVCTANGDCENRCCSKNLIVMPREGQQDLYNVRP